MAFGVPGAGAEIFGSGKEGSKEWANRGIAGRTLDFLRDSLLLSSLLEQRLKTVDFHTAERLIDQEEWIDTFRDTRNDVFAPPNAVPVDETKEFGPREFLLSLTPEDRQKVYLEFIDKYIPESVQRDPANIGIFDPDNRANPAVRFANLNKPASKAIVNDALAGMFDLEGIAWNGNSKEIAKASLQQHYKAAPSGSLRHSLTDDFKEALHYQKEVAGNMRPLTPDTLRSDIPASLLRGALNPEIGVITPTRFNTLTKDLQRVASQRDLEKGKTQREVGKLRGEAEARLEHETTEVADIWRNMNIIQKGVLIAGVVYLATKFKKTATVIGILAASVYYGRAFVFKDKTPGKTISDYTLKPLGDWASQMFNKKMGVGTGAQGAVQHTEKLFSFLDAYQRNKMEEEAAGLALINDVKFKDIVANFDMTKPHVSNWRLDTRRGGQINGFIQKDMENRGWDGNYYKYFENADNVQQLSQVVAFAFYLAASKEPRNLERIQQVEGAMRKLDANKTYNDLTDPALSTYMELAREGAAMYANNDQTMGDFIAESLQMREATAITNVEKNNPSADLIERKKVAAKGIAAREFGYPSFIIKIKGDKVLYGQDGLDTAETPVETIRGATAKQIVEKYNRWEEMPAPRATDDPFVL